MTMPKSNIPNATEMAREHIEQNTGGFPHGLSGTYGIEAMIAKSIASIDKFFGEGYARENPVVLAAAITASASLEHHGGHFGNIEDALTSIGNGLSELANSRNAVGA
jgi:glutamate-1-semialdehyde aminotransferase